MQSSDDRRGGDGRERHVLVDVKLKRRKHLFRTSAVELSDLATVLAYRPLLAFTPPLLLLL
jgi:hypothetical protein